MIEWAMRRAMDKIERNRSHDARRVRDMIDVNPRPARLFSRVPDLLATAVFAGFGLVAPADAKSSIQPAPASLYTLSPGRIGAIVAAVVGLIGAVVGRRALARSAGRIGTGN